MKISVLHPRQSHRNVEADLSPSVTGGQLVEFLSLPQEGQPAFFEPPPSGQGYMLVLERTRSEIQETQTLAQAGVQDDDALRTLLDVRGYLQ
jgi:hypothetical protein